MSAKRMRVKAVSSFGVTYDNVLHAYALELYCEGVNGSQTSVRIPVSRAHVEQLVHALGAAIAHEQIQQARMLDNVEFEITMGKEAEE